MAVITRWLPRSVARVSGSRLIKGTAVTFVILGSATGLRYGLQVFFARLGGVTQYGKYAYAMSLVQLVLIPAHLGFSYAVFEVRADLLANTRSPEPARPAPPQPANRRGRLARRRRCRLGAGRRLRPRT